MPASRTLAAAPRRFAGPLAPPPFPAAAAPDWTAISGLVAGGDTAGRALLAGDPALGRRPPDLRAGPAGLRGDPAGLRGDPAVLLLEPAEPLMAADPASGRTYDLQVELLVRGGFGHFPLDAPAPAVPAGWRVRLGPAGLELVDGDANVWARPGTLPEPRWLSTVDEHGHVLVLYGAWLGVQAPRSVRADQYGPSQRAAELRDARMRGLVAAAMVAWDRGGAPPSPQGGPLLRR
jgi:hypothetical protein